MTTNATNPMKVVMVVWVTLAGIVLVLLLREHCGGRYVAAVVGVLWLVVCARWWTRTTPRRLGAALLWPGVAMNMVALFANGGRMPVSGIEKATSLHVALTPESRVFWLCDIIGSDTACSFGDILILHGFALAGVLSAMRALTPHPANEGDGRNETN